MKVITLHKWWVFLWLKTSESEKPISCVSLGHGAGWNLAREDTTDWMAQQMFDLIHAGENINFFHKNWRWEDIGVAIGMFASKADAKKSGWFGELPKGFSKRYAKRLHRNIWLFVPPGNV